MVVVVFVFDPGPVVIPIAKPATGVATVIVTTPIVGLIAIPACSAAAVVVVVVGQRGSHGQNKQSNSGEQREQGLH